MSDTKNKYHAQTAYQKKHIKRYCLVCHDINDSDIIDYINNSSNKSESIKAAIRFYLANNSNK